MVRAKLGPVDISAIADRIAQIIDEKLEGVAILTPIVEGDTATGRVDLSGIDFDALAKLFETSPKVAAERLRQEAEEEANEMARQNPSRVQLVERLEKLVAEYNAGSIDAERFFDALKAFVAGLSAEQQRATREGLTEAELAIFDLLTNPEPKLTKAEQVAVRNVARELLGKLEELVEAVNWIGNQQTRGAVWTTIRQRLNELPEEPYPEELWNSKVDQVWQFVLQRYASGASNVIH
jgi:type I restriction enzyme R subunit